LNGYLALTDGRRIEVQHGLTFGRVAGNDVVLDDVKASRRHARLIVEAGVVEIEDLGSSNGTLLNGKPVTKKLVRPGDEITIGKTVMRYEAGVAPAGAVATAAAPAPIDDTELFGATPPSPTPLSPPQPRAAPPSPSTPPPPRPTPPSPTSPPPQPQPRPTQPPPSPSPTPTPPRPTPPASPTPPPPPRPRVEPPPIAQPTVVEFADEVVEVRKSSASKSAASPAVAASAAAGSEPKIEQQQRVLQFSRQQVRAGVLGDDLGQIGGAQRAVLIIAVVAAAVGLGYLVMQLVG
jgi:hypothetical protein